MLPATVNAEVSIVFVSLISIYLALSLVLALRSLFSSEIVGGEN
jgi:hypothetical protein